MYKKITQDFLRKDFNDWFILRSNKITSSYDSIGTKLEYFEISDMEMFSSLHLKRFCTIEPDRARFTMLTGRGFLSPHRDHNTSVALNCYLSATDDITYFYNVKENATSFQYAGKRESNVFDTGDLDITDSFIANSGDAYLLNVSQVHSVEKISSEPRIFLSYHWATASYDEVLEGIREANSGSVLI